MYVTYGKYLADRPTPDDTTILAPYANHYKEAPKESRTPVSVPNRAGAGVENFSLKEEQETGTSDPKIWGPKFWFSLHNSAAHYPISASPLVRDRMKGRLLAIPYEIPCPTCQPHASAYIEKHRDHLDEIVSGRHSLGKFYVDFHNEVNKRYGKPVWTYEQAYKTYSAQ